MPKSKAKDKKPNKRKLTPIVLNRTTEKGYLNKPMRDAIFRVMIMGNDLQTIIASIEDIPKYKILLKPLRTALTMFDKVIHACAEHMGRSEALKYQDYVRRHGYQIIPVKQKKLPTEIIIEAETNKTLVAATATAFCASCTVGDKYEQCAIRKAFIDAGIHPSSEPENCKGCRYEWDIDDPNADVFYPIPFEEISKSLDGK